MKFSLNNFSLIFYSILTLTFFFISKFNIYTYEFIFGLIAFTMILHHFHGLDIENLEEEVENLQGREKK